VASRDSLRHGTVTFTAIKSELWDAAQRPLRRQTHRLVEVATDSASALARRKGQQMTSWSHRRRQVVMRGRARRSARFLNRTFNSENAPTGHLRERTAASKRVGELPLMRQRENISDDNKL
jgi:hypothetical protein